MSCSPACMVPLWPPLAAAGSHVSGPHGTGADHPPPPSHHAGVLAASPGVGRRPQRLGGRVRTLPTPPVLRVQRRLLSSRIGGAVTNNDSRVQALWVWLRMSLANVIGVSGRIQVRRVSVHTCLDMVDVLTVVGRGEAACFHDWCHVNGRGRVSS